jgi:3-oxoadipate enol-lactonase
MTSFATTSSGTRIAYFESGRPWRPALILTHSLGSDHRMWAPQIETLKSDYFIIAIDNIGHGESSVPSGDYSIHDFAEAVIAVADAAELERFHYCGLSVGGITGLLVAAEHADRLLSLTVCNSAAKIGSADLWNQRIEIARAQGMDALVEGVIARWFSADFAEREPQLFEQARATLLATDPAGYAGVCAALRDGDLSDLFPPISTTTLLVGGINDQAAPIEQSRWLSERIAGSRLVELDAAHLSNLDRAEEFTPALRNFLASTTA